MKQPPEDFVTLVKINRDLLDLEFEDIHEAHSLAVALNQLVDERMPWAQAMLGLFATVESLPAEEEKA